MKTQWCIQMMKMYPFVSMTIPCFYFNIFADMSTQLFLGFFFNKILNTYNKIK
jgi:hypothetical protein